ASLTLRKQPSGTHTLVDTLCVRACVEGSILTPSPQGKAHDMRAFTVVVRRKVGARWAAQRDPAFTCESKRARLDPETKPCSALVPFEIPRAGPIESRHGTTRKIGQARLALGTDPEGLRDAA